MKVFVVLLASILCSCIAAPVYTRFESSQPGARIEINNEYVGQTPFTYKWLANMYSHFGKFADETSIRAYPFGPHQYQQRKYFESHHGDLPKIPQQIYFDMSSPDISKPESE
ncbi:MAG: PEGA domain-containing protein [Chthoniobacterales bacterium]